ncbi:RDD family protein [Marinicellulosiphila megalodicopiae]|uniref:RDD family protein n=1 Tax=Marinicellulosiphila megalodicopiae TaxID=2724896 RepID=UPI003BB156B5
MKLLSKQFYALCYDVMILIGFTMLVAALFQWADHLFFYQGEQFDEAYLKSGVGPLKIPMQITLMLCYFFYYHFSFTHGGQTIGMKAWKIQLISTTGKLKLSQTLVRYLLAWPSFWLGGIGYFTAFKDEYSRSIPDKYSGTQIILKI